jgi:iron complex outermembrane receptor protein
MKKYIFAILIVIAGLTDLHPESTTGKISGYIKDIDNIPVQYVHITIQELNIFSTSDSTGYFEFNDIPYSDYHFTFNRTGYITKSISKSIKDKENTLDVILEKSLIETATIDVTSSFEAQDITTSTFSISSISARNLIKTRDENLSSTISNLPGINSITTGIGIGKPVIRGLSSNSVLIVHDGVKHESQQWGDEHAPELSVYDLDRIEILRGPASLVYGSEGIGGVVNVISKPLQFSNTGKPLYYGDIDLGGFSVNNQTTSNLMLGMGLKNIGFKGHFGYRNSGNVKTPDGILLVNTLSPNVKDTIIGGTLSNSANKELEGGVSFSVNGDFGYINAGFENFNREIQMHDPDPLATGNQKLNTNQFEISGNINLSKTLQLEPILSYQDHSRREFESIEAKNNDIASLNWQLKTFQGDLRLHHDIGTKINGTIGVTLSKNKNESLGINKLIPGFNSTGLGAYILEKYNSEKWTFSAGGRYDTKNLDIQQTIFSADKTINAQTLNFNAFSGSVGAVYRPASSIDLFTNLGRGWRAPSEFELFVDGVHEGTGRVERGLITLNPNSTPPPEASLNFDFGIRTRLKNINAEISFFNNIVNNFVYPSPTNTIDSATSLPVYNIKQDKSTFTGIEYSLQYQPVDYILISWIGDYVKTLNNAANNPLPFTPPMKNIVEIKLQKNLLWGLYNPYLSFKAKFESPQNNVDPLETATNGYTLFYTGLGFDMVLAKTIASVDFSVDNLLDTKYVDHLSRYKSYAMNPGRSVNLKISVPFELK